MSPEDKIRSIRISFWLALIFMTAFVVMILGMIRKLVGAGDLRLALFAGIGATWMWIVDGMRMARNEQILSEYMLADGRTGKEGDRDRPD